MDDLELLLEFTRTNGGGTTWWVDPDGGGHWGHDVGYAEQYLEDLAEYVRGIGGMGEFRKRWEAAKRNAGMTG